MDFSLNFNKGFIMSETSKLQMDELLKSIEFFSKHSQNQIFEECLKLAPDEGECFIVLSNGRLKCIGIKGVPSNGLLIYNSLEVKNLGFTSIMQIADASLSHYDSREAKEVGMDKQTYMGGAFHCDEILRDLMNELGNPNLVEDIKALIPTYINLLGPSIGEAITDWGWISYELFGIIRPNIEIDLTNDDYQIWIYYNNSKKVAWTSFGERGMKDMRELFSDPKNNAPLLINDIKNYKDEFSRNQICRDQIFCGDFLIPLIVENVLSGKWKLSGPVFQLPNNI